MALIKMIKLVVILVSLSATFGLPTNSSYQDVIPKISGGDETDIAHNPWQLALLYRGQHFCGAVEIHPRWALTAAHCLHGAPAEDLSVRAGSTTKSFGGQVVDVVRIYEHPDYDLRIVDYDFALLELDEPITVQSASPVALPEPSSELYPGEDAVLSGWGSLTQTGYSTEILRVVKIPVISTSQCQEGHLHHRITNRMFCTSHMLDYTGACRGDGGGPVIINGRLEGVVSWGINCDYPSPGVHARVAPVLDWLYATSGI